MKKGHEMYIQLHTTAGRPIVLDTNKMSNFRYEVFLNYANVSFTIDGTKHSMFVSDGIEVLEEYQKKFQDEKR